VRLTRIDDLDLNLFEFDYDLTFMVFFMNAEEKVYARYGGRDAESPDGRHSLAGLDYTMKSVLAMHERADKAFAPKSGATARFIKDVGGSRRGGRCLHCHQVKEVLAADLRKRGQWRHEMAWRYPLPENLGLVLHLDRGNVLREVTAPSPALAAGLRADDIVQRLNRVPIHSFGDAQFALDRAPATGSIDIAWRRGDQNMQALLTLPEGWRKTSINWRASMQRFVPAARLYGIDLTHEEKKALGLAPEQLAFRQKDPVHSQARAAGIRPGDIILGVDDKQLDTDVTGFVRHVYSNYIIGDRVNVNLLRDGQRLNLVMTLVR
jgi:predicted metalloprotease with PDZ domain